MKEEVRIWIERGRRIGDGIKLLEHFGIKIHDKVARYRGKDFGGSWESDWVYQQLIKLPDDLVSPSTNADQKQPPVEVIAAKTIQTLTDAERDVYKQFDADHAALRHAQTDEERAEAAKNIMEVTLPAKDAIFEEKQAATFGGTETTQKVAKELTAKQVSERNNLRAQVSKLKAKLKKGGDKETLAAWETKLAKTERELAAYEQ